MKAARIREYNARLVLEDVPTPDVQPDEVLVQVQACGMCRSNVQLVDGYFRKYKRPEASDLPIETSLTSRCRCNVGCQAPSK